MRKGAPLVAIVSALAIEAAAEDLPTLSLRDMAIEADVIVVAEPIDGGAGALPTRYRVVEVLKGDAEKGLEIDVRTGMDYVLGPPRWGKPKDDVTDAPCIQKALLFLAPKHELLDGRRPVCSGIRALSDKDELLVPQQRENPGPMYLLPSKDGSYDAMLAEVRADLPRIKEIVKLGAIPDRAERNKAVLRWIEGHKDEFRHLAGRGKGWHSLEPRLFEWVMESCIPEDCWRAVELSAELETRPERAFPSFSSPRGREFLLAKVLDDKVPEPLRIDALGRLGGSCWPFSRQPYPGVERVSPDEQRRILDTILPFLDREDARWRRAAVVAVAGASDPRDAHIRHLASKAAVPRLTQLYRTETDPGVRESLIEALRSLEDDAFWKELSGNPQGIVVRVTLHGVVRDSCRFGLYLDRTRAKITEPPTLVAERLDGQGRVVETRSLSPSVIAPERLFERGWEWGRGQIEVAVPPLAPGTWRVTAVGAVGEARETWRSEAVKFEVQEPK